MRPFVVGRAEALPFPDNSFDFLTMGYALRHVTDLEETFREYQRVLKPGGKLLILEVTKPRGRIPQFLFRAYFGRIYPTLTQLFTRSADARDMMRYYWETMDACVPPEAVLAALRGHHRSGIHHQHRQRSTRRAAQPARGPPRSGAVEFLGNPAILPVKVARAPSRSSPPPRRCGATGATPPATNCRAKRCAASPHGLYALCAIEQALPTPGSGRRSHDGQTGLYCASAGSTLLAHYHVSRCSPSRGERCHPLGVVSSIAGTLNFNLAAHYGIRGAVGGFVAACASSSHALGCAWTTSGSADSSACSWSAPRRPRREHPALRRHGRAFDQSRSPRPPRDPFDAARDGFVGAGGAVALILEEAEFARARGATVYAELRRLGPGGRRLQHRHFPSRGHRPRRCHPPRPGRRRPDAPADIGYVNAHATSTPAGDRSEALALQQVSRHRAHPHVSSTKGSPAIRSRWPA
jgi:3-oxoacyl-[acyl-carrier-protein] synthase-1